MANRNKNEDTYKRGKIWWYKFFWNGEAIVLTANESRTGFRITVKNLQR